MLAENLAISVVMIIACVTIHSIGLYVLMMMIRSDRTRPWREGRLHRRGLIVIVTVFGLFLLHAAEVIAYALLYSGLDQFKDVETSLYFSITTFTTLGYGDVLLQPDRRLLAGIEGLLGLLLIGWSTAILVTVTTRLLNTGSHGHGGSRDGSADGTPQPPESP